MQKTHGLSGALDGLRVVDLSRILAGPWCTQNLADLGASVLKIERPGTGDDTRAWGPPFVQAPGGEAVSAYFLSCNRGKQSVALDFTEPASHAWLLRQIRDADVLVENYKAGALARHGLDYAALAAINPGLIYLSITGFGQSGPLAHKPGYDYVFQGLGGLMGYTGVADGEEGAGPLRTGVAVVDLMTGMYATSAVLAAVVQRQRTGRGQHIDLALLDVGVACLANQGMNYLYGGKVPQRMGNAHPNTVPYQDFPTADGHMILAVGNDGQFARLWHAAGQPGRAQDARFATNAARVAHRHELVALIRGVTVGKPTRDWIALLEQHGVPCGPINTVREVFDDPQVKARGMQIAMQHPQAGSVPLVASPLRLSDTPVSYRHTPPQLGQHTDAVLARHLGLAPEALQTYRDNGVLG